MYSCSNTFSADERITEWGLYLIKMYKHFFEIQGH